VFADLAPSCKTRLTFDGAVISPQIHQTDAIALRHSRTCDGGAAQRHGAGEVRAFGSTFLIFSDYIKPQSGSAPSWNLPVIYVFTHDSIGVAGWPDAPAIEQVASLRNDSGADRPAPRRCQRDGGSLEFIMKLHTRRPSRPDPAGAADHRSRQIRTGVRPGTGAYILADAPKRQPEVLLLATGSEVALCLDAYERLKADGVKAAGVSMPSWELFDDQPQEYRDRYCRQM